MPYFLVTLDSGATGTFSADTADEAESQALQGIADTGNQLGIDISLWPTIVSVEQIDGS